MSKLINTKLVLCQALVRMELVPVPCSCSEIILDYHLACNVALVKLTRKRSSKNAPTQALEQKRVRKKKDRIVPADTCQRKRAARNETAETRRQKRAGRTFEQHKQCNYE